MNTGIDDSQVCNSLIALLPAIYQRQFGWSRNLQLVEMLEMVRRLELIHDTWELRRYEEGRIRRMKVSALEGENSRPSKPEYDSKKVIV